MTERPPNTIEAELDAVRKRLSELESIQKEGATGSARLYRRGFSKGLAFGLAPFMGVLLLIGGTLYGQSGGDALFIDPRGWIGIGTNKPNATLDVAGNLNVSDSATVSNTTKTGSLDAGTLRVTKDANLANTTIKGTLTTEGNVGIGVASSAAALDVSGKANTDKQISLQLRSGNNGTNFESNQIAFGWSNAETYRHVIKSRHNGSDQKNNALDFYLWRYDKAKPDSAAIGGLLTMTLNGGNVGIGTSDPEAKLDVDGDARIRGKVSSYSRYQRDDQAESNYEASPRYHLSLTAPAYGGRTKSIPQNVLEDLCGDQDGCEYRLAMTRWSSDRDTESASRSGILYYSKGDGHWRASSGESDAFGVDGDGTTQHVKDIWGTCYFTDGNYTQYENQGDKEKGMQLLVWKDYTHPNRTCELTLID